jgi:NAD-dependent SIR2 family protein deacetylase
VADLDKVKRLKLRRPRRRIIQPDFPPPVRTRPDESLFPADVYVGSGLSYEAGLPTLCDMHDAFAVDCEESNGFMTGARDWLPHALAEDVVGRLRSFCRVHSQAVVAEPTAAMQTIAELANAGLVRRIFTDNVDNLLSKVNVPFERVRGSGVFNERYEARFASPSLLVIGVAADRRQIIRQARQRDMRIVVVNPCRKVSPNVTHLDYLTRQDVFYKTEAKSFFEGFTGKAKFIKS